MLEWNSLADKIIIVVKDFNSQSIMTEKLDAKPVRNRIFQQQNNNLNLIKHTTQQSQNAYPFQGFMEHIKWIIFWIIRQI